MKRQLRIAIVHNRYQQPGGEDRVYEAECSALEGAGHHVLRFEVHNDAVRRLRTLDLAVKTLWNRDILRTLTGLFRRERIDVVHVHNTLPLISPSVYGAARSVDAAVIQTLHNFRLLCPVGTLFRSGAPCEDCVGKHIAWPGIVHACYRNDRAATAVIAATVATHRVLGTYRRSVDRYIALTEFAKSKFAEGGVPVEKIVVKPNFVASPVRGDMVPAGPALFVGRLSDEKGVGVMLEAWQELSGLPPLRIVGDGPLLEEMRTASAHLANVTLLGYLDPEMVMREQRSASLLVFPSKCYEGFPLAIVEAMAAGLPVVAARLGSMPEIVRDNVTGLLFEPGNPVDLATKVRWLHEHPREAGAMGSRARDIYEAHYTPERNMEQLLSIYDQARTSRAMAKVT